LTSPLEDEKNISNGGGGMKTYQGVLSAKGKYGEMKRKWSRSGGSRGVEALPHAKGEARTITLRDTTQWGKKGAVLGEKRQGSTVEKERKAKAE